MVVWVVYAPAEVCEFDYSSRGNEDVFWFDVAVDDGVGVEVGHGGGELGDEAGGGGGGDGSGVFVFVEHEGVKGVFAGVLLEKVDVSVVGEEPI